MIWQIQKPVRARRRLRKGCVELPQTFPFMNMSETQQTLLAVSNFTNDRLGHRVRRSRVPSRNDTSVKKRQFKKKAELTLPPAAVPSSPISPASEKLPFPRRARNIAHVPPGFDGPIAFGASKAGSFDTLKEFAIVDCVPLRD